MAGRRGAAARHAPAEEMNVPETPPASTAIERATAAEGFSALAMVMSPAAAQAQMAQLQQFVASVMVPKIDFGHIPGVEKPTLLQPGAQKLAELYGLSHRFEEVEVVRDWDRMFFYFEYRTILTSRRDGTFIGEGIGSCNSKESKYAYRWVFDNEIPAGVDKRSLELQQRTSKKNGRQYYVYKLPNQDLASVVNTIQKMAAKRSYIHAVIAATRSSGLFTQDVEDLPASVLGRPEEEREQPAATAGAGEKPQPTTSREPRESSPAGAKTPADMQRRFAEHAKLLEECVDETYVKRVCRDIAKDQKSGALDARCLAELAKIRDGKLEQIRTAEAKARQEEVDATGELPDAWGGPAKPTGSAEPPAAPAAKTKEPDDGEPPNDWQPRGERQPGEEG